MSAYPPFIESSSFNPNLLLTDDYLTIETADSRYQRIGGIGMFSSLSVSGNIEASSYSIGGLGVNFASISGITNGIVSASKSVIVDANKDISGYRNITATGSISANSLSSGSSLSLTGASPSINISAPMTINNTILVSSGSQPTTGNYIGMRFNGIASEGIIRAYNYILSSYNNININDSAIYIKSNGFIGLTNSSPQQRLHVMGNVRIENGYIQLGTSTDTTRFISCLDANMLDNTTKYITLGKSDTSGNQLELRYKHVSNDSNDNEIVLGFHSKTTLTMTADYKASLGTKGSLVGLNILNSITNPSIRIGKYESTNNCISLTWTPTSDGSADNALVFNLFGTSNAFSVARNGCAFNGGRQGLAPVEIWGNKTYAFTTPGLKWYNVVNNTYATVTNATINVALWCGDGSIYLNSSIVTASDSRLKRNIEDYEVDERAYKMLKPKRYRKINNTKVEIGLLAQDVASVGIMDVLNIVPNKELKKKDEYDTPDGTQWSLEYDRLSIINISMIQKLLKRVDKIESILKGLNISIN